MLKKEVSYSIISSTFIIASEARNFFLYTVIFVVDFEFHCDIDSYLMRSNSLLSFFYFLLKYIKYGQYEPLQAASCVLLTGPHYQALFFFAFCFLA